MKKIIIDLVRHAECQTKGILRGQIDDRLTEQGRLAMLKNTLAYAAEWNQIISSPLSRCRLIAEQVARQHSLSLTVDNALQEIDFGDWDGLKFEQLLKDHPKQISALYSTDQNADGRQFPNGESFTGFQTRVIDAITPLLNRPQHLGILTHAGVIRAILAKILCSNLVAMQQLQIDFCSVTRIQGYIDASRPGELSNMSIIFISHNG